VGGSAPSAPPSAAKGGVAQEANPSGGGVGVATPSGSTPRTQRAAPVLGHAARLKRLLAGYGSRYAPAYQGTLADIAPLAPPSSPAAISVGKRSQISGPSPPAASKRRTPPSNPQRRLQPSHSQHEQQQQQQQQQQQADAGRVDTQSPEPRHAPPQSQQRAAQRAFASANAPVSGHGVLLSAGIPRSWPHGRLFASPYASTSRAPSQLSSKTSEDPSRHSASYRAHRSPPSGAFQPQQPRIIRPSSARPRVG